MTIRIDRMLLAEVTFPDSHPRFAEGGCPVFGYAVRHPDGVILFDTSVGMDNAFIDELYQPTIVPINDALAAIGIDERDVTAIVNSHLHFDHCGQNATLTRHGVPVYVADAEVDAAGTIPYYTVSEWAAVPPAQLRRVRGDERLAGGVTIIETPGHTPGHQSLVVETDEGRTVIAGQCVYQLAEITECRVAPDNMHDDEHAHAGQESLERLVAFDPCVVVAAHDAGRCTLEERR